MDWLSFLFPKKVLHLTSLYNRSIDVVHSFGRLTLLVDSTAQTGIYPDRLWKTGLVPFLKTVHAPKRIVVFGVGGGAVFHLLHRIFPQASLVGVDIDPVILKIAKDYFGLNAIPGLSLITQDAQRFVKKRSEQGKSELIVIDLYIGNGMPAFVQDARFYASLSRILKSGGILVMNYYYPPHTDRSLKSFSNKMSQYFRSVEYKPVLRNIFFYVVK